MFAALVPGGDRSRSQQPECGAPAAGYAGCQVGEHLAGSVLQVRLKADFQALSCTSQEAAFPGEAPTHRQHHQRRPHPEVRGLPGPAPVPAHPVRGGLGTDQHRLGHHGPDHGRGGGRGHPRFHQPGVVTAPAHQRTGHLGAGQHRRYCVVVGRATKSPTNHLEVTPGACCVVFLMEHNTNVNTILI